MLFGSAAQGTTHANSDLDLLVVVADGTHRRNTAKKIYRELLGVGFATDVVVVTESDVERYAEHQGMVISTAVARGRELYAA